MPISQNHEFLGGGARLSQKQINLYFMEYQSSILLSETNFMVNLASLSWCPIPANLGQYKNTMIVIRQVSTFQKSMHCLPTKDCVQKGIWVQTTCFANLIHIKATWKIIMAPNRVYQTLFQGGSQSFCCTLYYISGSQAIPTYQQKAMGSLVTVQLLHTFSTHPRLLDFWNDCKVQEGDMEFLLQPLTAHCPQIKNLKKNTAWRCSEACLHHVCSVPLL